MYLRKEYIADIQNELYSLLPKIINTIIVFFIRCLRLGSRGVHQTQVWIAPEKVWELLI